MVMSSDLPRGFAVAALVVVLIAAIILGMIVGYNLKYSAPISTATSASTTSKIADVTMVVQFAVALGPDGQFHDAFIPCNFTVYANQVVNLTVISYDNTMHSFTSTGLNVNFQIPPNNVTGVPVISHFQFTAPTSGVYRWYCSYPCDTDAGGWAMTTGSDGQPDQIGFMGGFVTVLPD